MEIPKYKFDKSLRWFKEVAKNDIDIAEWNAYKFIVMRECIELSLRFGIKPFTIPLIDFGKHVGMKRHGISRNLRKLKKEGWINYIAGKYTNHSAIIEVNWHKLKVLYEKHKDKFKVMEGEQESVAQSNAVIKSVNQYSKSVAPRSESVAQSANKRKDIENDKEIQALLKRIKSH